MGQDVDLRQTQAGVEAAEIGPGLAGFFRLGVGTAGAVHGTGADAQNGALEIFQQLGKADLLEIEILCGNMTTGQHNQIAFPDEHLGFAFVAAVQHRTVADGDAGLDDGGTDVTGEGIGLIVIVGIGADKQCSGLGRQGCLQPVDKAIGGGQNGPVSADDAGTAGHKYGHSGRSFVYCATL